MRALSEPILDGGVRTTHFFNGRLLSAEDLALDQAGNREARRRLGRAIGSGVAAGLDVATTPGTSSVTSPSVTVRAGLALDRTGHALRLAADTELSLVRRIERGTTDGAAFRECVPRQRDVVVTGDGLYALVICPASATEGRAPVSGLGNASAGCAARWDVEGVQFRLVSVQVEAELLDDVPRLRNRAAHACFGTAVATSTALVEPFSLNPPTWGVMDGLREAGTLTDCDVPLALLYWTARGGVQFVDNWSVRRRVTSPDGGGGWPLFTGDRRASEAEATFFQFQEQVDDMLAAEPDLTTMHVAERFETLPPLGILPVSVDGARTGFGEDLFDGFALSHVGLLDGARLRALLAESLHHEPVSLPEGGRVQLYVVHENQRAVEEGVATRRTLVFASTTLPFRGTARFGYGRWSRARYGTSR